MTKHTDIGRGLRIDAPVSVSSRSRSFLFLQGMATPFFDQLGCALFERGHLVQRVNFNGGDRFFWNLPGALDYRGNTAQWLEWLSRTLQSLRITDLVLFGDCRPLHRTAISCARHRGIHVHVFEEGYLRPDWITLELNGVNGNSSLPRDPAWFRAAARMTQSSPATTPVRHSFVRRALDDIAYQSAQFLGKSHYPQYSTHRPWPASVEYMAGLKRYLRKPFTWRNVQRARRTIRDETRPQYLFPLQLDADSQVRYHSAFADMSAAIRQVILSFGKHAPKQSVLVITEHPLDHGVTDLHGEVMRCAALAGLGNRIQFLSSGTPSWMLRRCCSIVTVNSTLGLVGLGLQIPVIALGDAIYDLPGLCFQGGLDDFWSRGIAPDRSLYEAFRKVLAFRTQINGGYFSSSALALAVSGAVERIEQAGLHSPRADQQLGQQAHLVPA